LSFAPVAPTSNHTESIFSVVFGVFTKMTNINALKRLISKGFLKAPAFASYGVARKAERIAYGFFAYNL
jgi:hypothetical protein